MTDSFGKKIVDTKIALDVLGVNKKIKEVESLARNAGEAGGGTKASGGDTSDLQLGETETTAYRGDRGKTAYDHSQTTGNPHGLTATDIGAITAIPAHNSLSGLNDGDYKHLTAAELAVVQATSGSNTGDQVADGTTITGAGTIDDPFVAVESTPDATEVAVDATGFDGNLSATDTDVQTALQTINDMTIGGGTADTTTVDTTGFTQNLSSADDTVQKALNTLDQLVAGGGGGVSSSYFQKDISESIVYSGINSVSNLTSDNHWTIVKTVKNDNDYQYRTVYTATGAWDNRDALSYTTKKTYQN